MFESDHRISQLRRRIARIERRKPVTSQAHISFGHDAIDDALGGGLARGRLHELFAFEAADASSAAGFAAMLGRGADGPVVWLREGTAQERGGGLHAPGLGEIGVDPARVILGVMPDARAVLRAGLDVVRCPEAGVAVIELWQAPPVLDLTATRRLAVAAAASGVTVLLLRIAAQPVASAAHTRWSVKAAQSSPLDANAPGHAALEVELLRQRGGPEGLGWLLEWDRDQGCFRDRDTGRAALPGAVVPFSASRPAEGVAHLRHAV